jgi:hypothetical protein
LESSRRKPNKQVFIYKKEMSKVVKLKQKDVEGIVKNVIKENEEIDERMMINGKMHYVYASKDSQGNYMIRDIKTDELLARHNSNNSNVDDEQSNSEEDLPMAAE